MQSSTDSVEQHRQRSDFIKSLVQKSGRLLPPHDRYRRSAPRSIVQFWHAAGQVPSDVADCINSWRRWTAHGFTHQLFDEHTARDFICRELGFRHQRAFEQCYHPAMQADYFRLCYLYVCGGLYVDADDVCITSNINFLFDDGRLKVQPLCYDMETAMMVPPELFLRSGAGSPSWIFYLNNNPLLACSCHPVLEQALRRATDLLDFLHKDHLPEIQETTGPGNLSKTVFEMREEDDVEEGGITVVGSWESIAVSKWPLSYRNDTRNWRLSNQRTFISKERV